MKDKIENTAKFRDRRPIAIVTVVVVAGVVAVALSLVLQSAQNWAVQGIEGVTLGSGSRGSSSGQRTSMGGNQDIFANIELLPATDDGTIRGQVICSDCNLQTGESCQVLIHNEAENQLVQLLPNEKADQLHELIGST